MAIAKSAWLPSFLSSAGARLTTITRGGTSKPLFLAHALAALSDRRLGQTDDLHLGEAVGNVDLHLDATGIDAPGCGSGGVGKHDV